MCEFYRCIGNYELEFKSYKNIEEVLMKCEVTKEIMVGSEQIKTEFIKELATGNISVFKAKQWLLWSMIDCLIKLKDIDLLSSMCESYLQSIKENLKKYTEIGRAHV